MQHAPSRSSALCSRSTRCTCSCCSSRESERLGFFSPFELINWTMIDLQRDSVQIRPALLLTTASIVYPTLMIFVGSPEFIILVLIILYSSMVMYSLWAKFREEPNELPTVADPTAPTNFSEINLDAPAPTSLPFNNFETTQGFNQNWRVPSNQLSPPAYQSKA